MACWEGSVRFSRPGQCPTRAKPVPSCILPDSSPDHPDSRTLAVGTQQGHVELWSLADPTAPLLRLPAHRGFVTALAFDAQGRHLASGGSDKLVEVWDLERIRADLEGLGLAW